MYIFTSSEHCGRCVLVCLGVIGLALLVARSTVEMLLCNARLRYIEEDSIGNIIARSKRLFFTPVYECLQR